MAKKRISNRQKKFNDIILNYENRKDTEPTSEIIWDMVEKHKYDAYSSVWRIIERHKQSQLQIQ